MIQISRNLIQFEEPGLIQVLLRCRSNQFHQTGFQCFVLGIFVHLFLMRILRQFLVLFQLVDFGLQDLSNFAGNRFDANHGEVGNGVIAVQSFARVFIVKASALMFTPHPRLTQNAPSFTPESRESPEQVRKFKDRVSVVELAWERVSTMDLSHLSSTE